MLFNAWIIFLIILSLVYGYLSIKISKKYFISISLIAIWTYSYGLFEGKLSINSSYIYLFVLPVLIFILPMIFIYIENNIKK